MNRWEAPFGSYDIEWGEHGVSSLRCADSTRVPVVDDQLAASLVEHIHGRPGQMGLDLQGLTPLAQVTLAKLLEIPYGEVRSYAWVAREIGRPAAVRSVATAIASNPIPLLIPCHRVVRSDWRIGDYSLGGAEAKKRILDFEGVDTAWLESLSSRSVRVFGDAKSVMFHLPTCRTLVAEVDPVEFCSVDEAHAKFLQPCSRCRP